MPKATVIRSFVAQGVSANEGDVISIPLGVDWVECGLVALVAEGAIEAVLSNLDINNNVGAVDPAIASQPVTAVRGIGSVTAGRLSEIGIVSVADLVAAEAMVVASYLNIDVERVEKWLNVAVSHE